ncbi:uncharacterized protein MELLADRAFT_60741 [Melampsora larici-populina 98AG31]|uniref:Secreted protein n=1 Tax=Melampsora larici-populina (strain 98AG31 / pathotype 3-4-7) TaxID=747676 RepID=F4RCN7_MELLP|nr:uncharacterized protein MELLADRAFT_60741 [Melampsora larici-populina 98AG31]EGG09663.1 hypothetical protein MELLADRAFT_60741 [Melampsora larici-populina 98AG31]
MISTIKWLGVFHLLLCLLLLKQIDQTLAFEDLPDLNSSLDHLPIKIEDSPPTSPLQEFPSPIKIEDSPPTSPLQDQQDAHRPLGYTGENSQGNLRRLQYISSRKNKEPQSNIQDLENLQYMEVVDGGSLHIPKPLKKAKFSSKNREIGGPSNSKIDSSAINLIDNIKEMAKTHDLIPSTLVSAIDDWFTNLEAKMSDKIKGYDSTYKRKRIIHPHVRRAVSKANAVATSFLVCLKLLHEDQYHEVINWEEQILQDGWVFIRTIFEEWNGLEQDDLNISKTTRKMSKSLEHINDLQPSFLYHHLVSVRLQGLNIKFLWNLWKRWYRESGYYNKRFLATQTCFVRHIQYLILHNGFIDSPINPEVILQGFKQMDKIESHQQMLKEHILQFDWPKRSNSDINPDHLERMLHHVGQLELELLEQHQPVEEYLENINQHFLNVLPRQENNKENHEDKLKVVFKCVGATYRRLIPTFFGAVKLMEDPKSLVPAKDEDKTVYQAWKFIKNHLDHWKNIDLSEGYHLRLSENFSHDHDSKESYWLFLEMLNLNSDSPIPFGVISRLYYPQNSSPNKLIREHGIMDQQDTLKHKLIESFLNLQNQVS